MLFSELYSSYYNTVAQILKYAVRNGLTEQKLREIVQKKAFGESGLTIPNALKSEKWQLITNDLKTPLKHEPAMPLTALQKKWLKAISLDSRIKLFDISFEGLDNVEPLFTPDMICCFDKYEDGDSFDDEGYIARFRMILDGIKNRQALTLKVKDRRGKLLKANVMPEYLEYSEKDDKFRLITSGCRYRPVVKLSSIVACKPCFEDVGDLRIKPKIQKASVTFTLFDGRNALERAMLHFAHFEKTVEKADENRYTVSLTYDPSDETEILIRILSFGPFIKVTAPESFVNLIKERLIAQKRWEID